MKKRILFILMVLIVVWACRREVFEVVEGKPGGNGAQDTCDYVVSTTPYDLDQELRDRGLPPPRDIPVEMTEEGIELGRKLFYDPILSSDNTLSCAGCHAQEFGFTDSGNRLSEGVLGKEGTRNSMALFNLVYFDDFFWDGREESLPSQAIQPVIDHVEMNNTWSNAVKSLKGHDEYPGLFKEVFGCDPIDSTLVADAITQFELTLITSNSKFDRYLRYETSLTPQEQHGYTIFSTEPRRNANDPPGGDCFHCHSIGAPPSPPLFTNREFMNNGLDSIPDEGLEKATGKSSDRGKFKVPSLRNAAETGPYMHDGRFATLMEVIEHYNSGVKVSETLAPIMLKTDASGNQVGIAGGLHLSESEKQALVAFLKALSDGDFLTDTKFSNPHKQ